MLSRPRKDIKKILIKAQEWEEKHNNGINSKLDTAKEKIGELEDIANETIQYKKQTGKKKTGQEKKSISELKGRVSSGHLNI
jgi:hypothetical protein